MTERVPSRFSLRDAIVAATVIAVGAAMLLPALSNARERARRSHCADKLRQIGLALHEYHDVHGSLPPAAVWSSGPLRSLMLVEVKRIDHVTYENWAQLLLPHLGQAALAAEFDRRAPVMAAANERARLARPPQFICPADAFNRSDNAYAFQPRDEGPVIAELARGNYAINGGTHNYQFFPENAAHPRGDGLKLVLDERRRSFEMIGNGVAGVNHGFRLSEFANGQSTLVATEEIRSGIDPLDPRGVWSLGQIGGSITWGHGVSSDDSGPNNSWPRADDILGCGRLHHLLGGERLQELGMPCVDYIDHNNQATARSMHPGGAQVVLLDGAVRFVSDQVDRGVWHVMHSRETPSEMLDGVLDSSLGPYAAPPDEAPPARAADVPEQAEPFSNSLDMKFVFVPAGEFSMGLPNQGGGGAPPECPAHRVRISRGFWLGRDEVTQAQYQSVTGRNPSEHVGEAAAAESSDDFPVEQVSWFDAAEFCRALSVRADEAAAGRRYRLPTEAEWEYACRAGKSTPYAWSATRRPGDDSGETAGIDPGLPVTAVGSYRPNEFGLYDMRGNVWEWCSDWFDRTYYARSPSEDPRGPARGFLKVVRGGDWIFVGEPCHINYTIMPPWKASPYVGFRIVCEVSQ